MNINTMRLRQLVNSGGSFYPAYKRNIENSEFLNKYDSDEEEIEEFKEETEIVENVENIEKGAEVKSTQDSKNIIATKILLSSFKTSEKKSKKHFEKLDGDFFDEEVINMLETLTNENDNFQLLKLVQNKFDSQDENSILFYSNVVNFILNKMTKCNEETHISDLVISLANLILTSSSKLFNNKDNKNFNERILYYSISIVNNILENFIPNIKTTQFNNFLTLSVNQLLILTESNDEEILQYMDFIGILKNILINTNSLLNQTLISSENMKNLFILAFRLIKIKNLFCCYLPLVELINFIVDSTSSEEYIEKFFEYSISFFLEFIESSNISEEKFYILDNRYTRSYHNYFGVYKCFNGDGISLFTYLYLTFFSKVYLKESNLMLKAFEILISKTFEMKKNTLLLIFYCLIDDITKIKYNIEFSISLVILTNFFICFSNLINQNELEINKKKLFMNLFEMIIKNIFTDFKNIKNANLCFGKENGNDKPCNCFSCALNNRNSEFYFTCPNCKWKTNLILQISEISTTNEFCGFCKIKYYFESSNNFFSDLVLNETNQNIIEEYSKGKIKDESNNNNEIFDKFLTYQEILYKNSFLFTQISCFNYVINFNKNSDSLTNSNLDLSFKIFIKNLISDQKINLPTYKNFNENIINLYGNLKNRIFNNLSEIDIDNVTINYFYFFYYYVNFLFAGHWKIVDILFDEGVNTSWAVKLKLLKILEHFIIFEGESIIFQNFQAEMLGLLLSDPSLYVKEYALEILFKLYQFKKISKSNLLMILFENINVSSFLIRKRITKALINLVSEEKEDKEHLKSIIYIFLNRIIDISESLKIKNIIYDFFYEVFSQNKKCGHLREDIVLIFIHILKDNNDSTSNIFIEHFRNLFRILFEDRKLKEKFIVDLIDHIFSNYIVDKFPTLKLSKKSDATDETEINVHSLNLIRILSSFNQESIVIYFETLLEFMSDNCNISNDMPATRLDNFMKQVLCEIFGNMLNSKDEVSLKSRHLNTLEILLLKIIITKPNDIMISAIKCYSKMIQKGKTTHDKLRELTNKNFYFLENQISIVLKEHSTSGKKKLSVNNVPLAIIYKSLTLLSYIAYCTESQDIENIFNFLESEDNLEHSVCENIFRIFKNFILYHSNNLIKFSTFDALGYFWIRFPHKLAESNDVIETILSKYSSDEEKFIVIKTFSNFFENLNTKIQMATEKQNTDTTIDFGGIHLFFEKFIYKISDLIVKENNSRIRLHAINLIRLLLDSGNLNLHMIMPYMFASLTDYIDDIRHISVEVLEKLIKISQDKFFTAMKENLKMSFNFQKKIYTLPYLINSFIKSKADINSDFITESENIFELLTYKIGKNQKQETFVTKIIDKIIVVFNEINNLENDVEDLSNTIIKFEFYEYLANLIADFKFNKVSDIIAIFLKLYKNFRTEYLVLNTKIKEAEESKSFDNKLIILFISVTLKSSLFKFLFSKYHNLDILENVITKDYDKFNQLISNDEFEDINKVPVVSKEFKNIKFYQFYGSTSLYLKKIVNSNSKKNKKVDKQKSIDLMKGLKKFEKLSTTEIRQTVFKLRNKLSKFDCEQTGKLLFSAFYEKEAEVKKEKTETKTKITNTELKIKENNRSSMLIKNSNNRKRITLDELSDDENLSVKKEIGNVNKENEKKIKKRK